MNVWIVDFWANNWDSAVHRASPLAKVIAIGLIIASIVLTGSFVVLVVAYLSIATTIVAARLPAPKIISIAAYPGIFAVLFAVSRWDGSLLTPTIIILKAITSALAMLLLISTTAYPDIFATFRFAMPRVVADSLFLAYRSLFILLELMGNLLMALRLRGGLRKRHYIRNAKNLATGLGLLLVRSLVLSERLYDVMRIRGYSGKLASRTRWQRITRYDAVPFALSLWIVALTVAFRLWPAPLAAYNGYALLLAIFGLLSATIYARWPHPTPIRQR